MEFYNNILCFPAHLYFHKCEEGTGKGRVIEEHYVSFDTYKKQVQRGKVNVVRPGKGEGCYALIELASIPMKYRVQIEGDYPVPERYETSFFDGLTKDAKAFEFYAAYRHPDGTTLNTKKTDNVTLYGNSASILSTIKERYDEHASLRARQGKKPAKTLFFENAAANLRKEEGNLQRQYPHNLPLNGRRLRDKFENFMAKDYEGLIKQNKGKKNAQKIDDNLLRLLAFIAGHETRPYNTKVVEYYMEFMYGKHELIDRKTGEEFLPENYLKNGKVVEFTEEAVWYRLNQPAAQLILDKKRFGYKDFNDTHRPHRHRHSPFFSFSKISMDDRDLVWKDKNSKKRVKAYYAYDVASGCRIGSAYSMDKNEELFLDCLRDMFVFADRNGFGMPMEVEVENHLVNKFFDDLKRMFPLVTICAPGNSQEKRAEHFNRAAKYSVEKNNHPGVGRWWLKSKYNRISVDKVDDQFKQTLKDKDRMIVDDIQDTLEYNNQLHPKQDLYPGMTRMEVLVANLNPDLPQLNKALIYRYIGFETAHTTIRRSQYVEVQGSFYMLPDPSVLELLGANNRTVNAYWMPGEDGSIDEVYLYQNGEFICTADKIIEYNEAKAERTELDIEAKLKQDKYVSRFDKYVRNGIDDFANLLIQPKEEITEEITEVEIVPDHQPEHSESLPTHEAQTDEIDYAQKALSDFF